jgi:hypothetical protein
LHPLGAKSLTRGTVGSAIDEIRGPSTCPALRSTYVAKSKSRVGVYLTFERGPIAAKLYAGLLAQRGEIEKLLGIDMSWQDEGDGKYSIISRKSFPDVGDPKYRADIIEWLRATSNKFVTAFRPRIEALLSDFASA